METTFENRSTLSDALSIFKGQYRHANIERELAYSGNFYDNKIGGYILRNINTVHYLIHYNELDPEWNKKTNYYDVESEAFFIPVNFVELATMETAPTIITFIIHEQLYYANPKDLQNFYMTNKLYVENEYGELVVPIPVNMLTINHPKMYEHN